MKTEKILTKCFFLCSCSTTVLDQTNKKLGIKTTTVSRHSHTIHAVHSFRNPARNHYRNRTQPIRHLVMHYTVDAMKNTLIAFSSPDPNIRVSSHYIITEHEPSHALPGGVIIGMVPENKVARHAGISSWQGAKEINETSIGIENINRTNLFNANNGPYDPQAQRTFVPFDEHQIKVLGTLAQSIIKTYAIKPDAVGGHSDISVHRDNGTDKMEPGAPCFHGTPCMNSVVLGPGQHPTSKSDTGKQFNKT